MKALSTQEDPSIACTPFDARRSGFVMGEGAGALMLEEYEHAVARGAKIYGELCGYGVTCDAYHITAPQPDGLGGAAALKMALEEAGGCEDYSKLYINAHRHQHAFERRLRDQGHQDRPGRGGGPPVHGVLYQVHDGPHAGAPPGPWRPSPACWQ